MRRVRPTSRQLPLLALNTRLFVEPLGALKELRLLSVVAVVAEQSGRVLTGAADIRGRGAWRTRRTYRPFITLPFASKTFFLALVEPACPQRSS